MANQYTAAWTENEIEFLQRNYSKIDIKSLQKQINQISPSVRTLVSIRAKANKLGVTSVPDGMLSLVDVMESCGVESSSFFPTFKRELKKFKKKHWVRNGWGYFVSVDFAEHLEGCFKDPPAHYIPTRKAIDLIGVTKSCLASHIKKKNIPFSRKGGRYYVPDWVVHCYVSSAKKTGNTRIDWHQAISDYAKKRLHLPA